MKTIFKKSELLTYVRLCHFNNCKIDYWLSHSSPTSIENAAIFCFPEDKRQYKFYNTEEYQIMVR